MTETLRNGKKTALLKALRVGNTRAAAARAVGIHIDTFHDWLTKDPKFSEAVVRAEAEAEQYYLSHIQQAAPGDWRAAAFWLERRRPADYGKRDGLDVTSGGKTIPGITLVEVVKTPPAALPADPDPDPDPDTHELDLGG